MLRMVLAQINTIAGAVHSNQARIAAIATEHRDTEIIVFPEMTLSGYPIGDLVERPDLLSRCRHAAEQLAEEFATGPALIVGAPWLGDDPNAHIDRVQGRDDPPIFNAVLLLEGGKVHWIGSKHHLPNEGVFDEKRNFAPAAHIAGPVQIAGIRFGVMVCHDVWFADVAETMVESGAEALIVLNASPWQRDGKAQQRFQACLNRVVETRRPMVMVNLVGAQDGVVFDGASLVLNADRGLAYQAPSFEEDVRLIEWQRNAEGCSAEAPDYVAQDAELPIEAEVYRVICLGLQDFVRKNHFGRVVLGLSGGVDSALVATLAVDALGTERVQCIMMSSPYTSEQSLTDAETLAQRLGVRYNSLAISDLMQCYDQALTPLFTEKPQGVSAENLQARIRGSLLMAASNHFGALLLTTGNKSEIAVGYCTLYGDMCGGFNPIADLFKTEIYALCRWRNLSGDFALGAQVIPQAILERAPSAELAPGQRDDDCLLPYEVLDRLLEGILHRNQGMRDLMQRGFARSEVLGVLKLLDAAQHKRHQSAVGVKLTSRALKSEWRYPLSNSFCSEL